MYRPQQHYTQFRSILFIMAIAWTTMINRVPFSDALSPSLLPVDPSCDVDVGVFFQTFDISELLSVSSESRCIPFCMQVKYWVAFRWARRTFVLGNTMRIYGTFGLLIQRITRLEWNIILTNLCVTSSRVWSMREILKMPNVYSRNKIPLKRGRFNVSMLFFICISIIFRH